jgi:hypothetical protein
MLVILVGLQVQSFWVCVCVGLQGVCLYVGACVCVCMCVCVCLYVGACVCVCMWVHVCVSFCIGSLAVAVCEVGSEKCVCVCVWLCVFGGGYLCVYVCMLVAEFIYRCLCVHMFRVGQNRIYIHRI